MKFLLLFCLVVFPIIAFPQIGKKNHEGVITGTWVSHNHKPELKLLLNPHGIGQFGGDSMRYARHGHRLHITIPPFTTIYKLDLQGDTMRLSGGDLSNELILVRRYQSEETVPNELLAEPDIPQSLIGIWSGYDETIEFKPDAQCIYRGSPWPYTVKDDVIILQTHQGNFIMHYRITDGKLRLTFGGVQHVYEKM